MGRVDMAVDVEKVGGDYCSAQKYPLAKTVSWV